MIMKLSNLGKHLAHGAMANIYSYDNNNVLKLFNIGISLDEINNEIKSTRFAKDNGLSVPDIKEMVTYQEQYGIVMERIKGYSMWTMIWCHFWEICYYAHILAKIHVSINSKLAFTLESIHSRLYNDIRDKSIIPETTKKIVLNILEKLPDGNNLCHLDFYPRNILMSSNGPVIIDWTTGGRGDPMADVARTWFLCTQRYPNWLTSFIFFLYFKEYSRQAVVSKERFEQWKIPIIAARIRIDKTSNEYTLLYSALEKKLKIYS